MPINTPPPFLDPLLDKKAILNRDTTEIVRWRELFLAAIIVSQL